jgi:signal transduction histidine kinase
MPTAQRETFSAAESDDALARALLEGLDLPLAALRAVLESLARDLGEDPRAASVAGALAEVTRAGRTVQDLVDFAAPPELMPLQCTIEEIISGARQRLPRGARERVLVARGDRGYKLFVDGPLLARTLHRLLEAAVDSGSGHVLVSVRRENGATLFTTVSHESGGELDADLAGDSRPARTARARDLGLALARRDIARMGGELCLTRTPRGEIVAVAHVPDASPSGRS